MPPAFYAHDPFLAVHRALQSPWLDFPAALASTACEGWALAIIGALAFSALTGDRRRFVAVYLPFVVALVISGALAQDLKDLLATPRPLAVYGAERIRIGLEPLFQFGFPSGHSMAVATFCAYSNLAFGRSMGWAWGLGFLGGLSRVYVGAHWVTDVLGGWALGVTLGCIAYGLACWASPRGYLVSLRARRHSRVGAPPFTAIAPDAPRSP